MKKYGIYTLFLCFIFTACEKDDFCTKEVPKTPKLIIRFYDDANKDALKEVENLSVWAAGKDTLSPYKSLKTDSIAFPLNIDALETVYFLKRNNVDGNLANNITNKITIAYTTEDIFISRSCGYKTYFNEVTITSDNGWFISFTPNSLATINNEFNAHVKVYH